MKSSSFINKIKIYSVVAFLLPLLAINSCLLLYKVMGNIQLYPPYNWNEKIIEIAFNLDMAASENVERSNIIKSYSYVDCPKYNFKRYVVTTENDVIFELTENQRSEAGCNLSGSRPNCHQPRKSD